MIKKNKIEWIVLFKAILFIFFIGFLLVISIQLFFSNKERQEEPSLLINKVEPIFDKYGVIENIKNNTIIIRYQPITESDLDKAMVIINSETEIKKITIIKPPTEIMPMQFREKTIYFSELKEGDEIVVFADEDIRKQSEFVAKKIQLIERKY